MASPPPPDRAPPPTTSRSTSRWASPDDFGNLYVTSSSTVRMLPATDAGSVDGSGEVQTIYGAPPRDTFPASVSFCLTGIAVVDAETLWVTDSCTGMLIELWRQPPP